MLEGPNQQFSSFQLENKITFYTQNWPYMVAIQKKIMEKIMNEKDCNFEPFCFLIKSVLQRRENK